MVPSSALTIAVDDKRLTCGGFALSETVRLGSFEFNADYIDGLSLSPRSSKSGTAFMGSTCNGSPSLRWAIIKDSIKEFHTMSSGEGGNERNTALGSPAPSRRWHNGGASSLVSKQLPWPYGTSR
jgi:hypothetical protein